jgi:hypothetical protein
VSKLWLIGDSFLTRCQHTQTGERYVGDSWTEQFAKNIGYDPEYYWSYGSLSNHSILLGLDCVYNEPRFDINNDKVLVGFTATSRQMVQGRAGAPVFDRTRGLRNEVEGSIVGTTFLDQTQFPMGLGNAFHLDNQSDPLIGMLFNLLTPEIKQLVQDYYEKLYPIEFDEYMQCMNIDGAITRAKQRGIDIIAHPGFIDYPYWNTDQSVEHIFDWHNKEIFSVPSYNIGYKYAVEEEEQFRLYSNHMSPDTAKQYAQAFTEYYNVKNS